MVKKVTAKTVKNLIALRLMNEQDTALDCKYCSDIWKAQDTGKSISGAHTNLAGCCKHFQETNTKLVEDEYCKEV